MFRLQDVADLFYVCCDDLRRFAFEICGVPTDTPPGILDTFLQERLATGVNLLGVHFGLMGNRNDDLRQTMDFGMYNRKGDFKEKCAAALAEVVANPIFRHEIMLHRQTRMFDTAVLPNDLLDYNHAASGLHESFADTVAGLEATGLFA